MLWQVSQQNSEVPLFPDELSSSELEEFSITMETDKLLREKQEEGGERASDRASRAYHSHIAFVSKKTLIIFVVITVLTLAAILTVTIYFALKLKKDKSPEAQVLSPKSAVATYPSAAVAADSGPCSTVGKETLEQGGKAVDAMIASLLCNGVHNMHSMGIGGGAFWTIYNRQENKAYTIDSRESAPSYATEDMYVNDSSLSMFGTLASGVPGEIRGYWTAYQKHGGGLPWRQLFLPTIRMCREGFQISDALANAMNGVAKTCANKDSSNLREVVFDSSGEVRKAGDTLKLPELADTLERIANGNATEFYTGETARMLADDIQQAGGKMTVKDLADYQVWEKDPVSVHLDSLTIHSTPPPGSGAVLQLILNILDGYDMSIVDSSSIEKVVLSYHRVIEAFKFAYAKRSWLGDDKFINVSQLVAEMTNEEYAESIRQKIWDNSTHANISYYGPSFGAEDERGTAHISLVGPNGDAVAVTSTVNWHFGSCFRSKSTGIVMNNEMDDFSTPGKPNGFGVPPSPSNFIKPGKRPMSSMCPAIIVRDGGDVDTVIGASGGTKITTAMAWVIVHSLWLQQPINMAIDQLRLHHQLVPNEVQHEAGFAKIYLDGLAAKGHNITGEAFRVGSSIVQAVTRRDGKLVASSDFRKGGYPDGY